MAGVMSPYHSSRFGNHLAERLLDQAEARASYTTLFGGRSRSIPQGMFFECPTLCNIIILPNKTILRLIFLILRPLSLKLDITFWGTGGWGGVSKVGAQHDLKI